MKNYLFFCITVTLACLVSLWFTPADFEPKVYITVLLLIVLAVYVTVYRMNRTPKNS